MYMLSKIQDVEWNIKHYYRDHFLIQIITMHFLFFLNGKICEPRYLGDESGYLCYLGDESG